MSKKRFLGVIALIVVACWMVLCQLEIAAAEKYVPEHGFACAEVQQLAVQVPTGALHVFSSCVPPGWVSLSM